jgi:hypothetical protein
VRSLPANALKSKTAESVKGGSVSFPYGRIKWTYTKQKAD